jgi:hypothetical protein
MLLQQRMRLASLLLLVSVALLHPAHSAAQETLHSVLERIRIQEPRHFSYREIRTLQLLAEPWQATGDMYISPQQMIIAQQSPTRVFTVISADRMQHIDTEHNINRSLKLEQPFAVPGMEPFMHLLFGTTTTDTGQEQAYVISLDTAGQRWLLQLTPQRDVVDKIIRMQLSGNTGHGPDQLVLEHADGDRTEWQLSLLSQGKAAGHELQQLLGSIH